MAVTLLRVLVLGVIAAAADDVPITWWSPPRVSLPCSVPDADRIPTRRPPPLIEADDRPRPKPYVWRKGDEELKRVLNNGTLEVRKKDGNVDGVYQCGQRYHGGLVLGYPVHLKFAYLDKQFSVHPENATVRRGQPFVLNCDINSGPAAVVSWQRDGAPLPQNSRYHLLKNQLLITDVTREDAGLYRCKATNTYVNKTRISHGGRLQVDEYPIDSDPGLLPVHHEEHIVVARGGDVVLPCPVTGWPRPKLIWELSVPGQRTSELEDVSEVLVLRNIDLDQEGVYTCTVEGNSDLIKSIPTLPEGMFKELNKYNKLEHPESFNVTITEPVNISVPPSSRQAIRASTVRFNCTATGRPAPTITWYKDGKPLTLAGRIVVLPSADGNRMELLIRSVTSDDAGVYQCFARGLGGVSSRWAWLNVTGSSAAAPRGVSCGAVGARAVSVWWPAVQGRMAYTVQVTMPGGTSLPGRPVTGETDIIQVNEPLTPYAFQVRAYIKSPNRNVASDMSESVICQGQGVPIKLLRMGEDILITWKQFSEETPGVLEWILQYKAENTTKEHNITLDGSIYNYTMKVSPEVPLQVRVLGTKILPWLHQNLTLVPWSSTTVASGNISDGTSLGIPHDVEVTELLPTQLTVRWKCDQAEVSSEVYQYMVCVRKLDGNEDCVESHKTSATIDKLLPQSAYEVRVQARVAGRAGGVGEFSDPIHISTPPEGPQRFKDLTYKLINNTTLRVSWNSVPDKYTVQYTDVLELPFNQWLTVETVGNTVLLTGLDLTKELHVMVTGYEPVGHSSILHIPVQVPEAKDLQYYFTRSGIQVTWKGEGPRIVKYSQNLTQSLDKWPTINVTTNTVHISGDLQDDRRTYVMVIIRGNEPRSQVLTVPPRPPSDNQQLYLSIGLGVGALVLVLLAVAAVCLWRRRKQAHSPLRSRRRNMSPTEGNEEAEMNSIGTRLANGGSSKDAGEPLLNGHVNITENPNQSKTPNGRMRKGKLYEATFDVARYEDPDTTLETVLDPDTSASTTFNLLDTSRRPEYDLSRGSQPLSANNSFNKLPDDNMNSELTRSSFQLDNSKILPTLQPNG